MSRTIWRQACLRYMAALFARAENVRNGSKRTSDVEDRDHPKDDQRDDDQQRQLNSPRKQQD